MDASHSRRPHQYRALSSSFHRLFFLDSPFIIAHLFPHCIGQDKPMYSKRYGCIAPVII